MQWKYFYYYELKLNGLILNEIVGPTPFPSTPQMNINM
jgi:hypothetical protein